MGNRRRHCNGYHRKENQDIKKKQKHDTGAVGGGIVHFFAGRKQVGKWGLRYNSDKLKKAL